MKSLNLKSVGKNYILRFEKQAIIKDIIPRLFKPKIEKKFWALRNINFSVEKGESIGVIGDNGSGKTTLLSLIARTTYPSEGEVITNGRVSTILSLGAGFHMDLTGIDNIFLNGIILGMDIGEIKNKLPSIINFSGLKEFINQPFYTYSSGMMLRLGFSVAIHVNFDILLIDEILSVGDVKFQEKCINKIKEFKNEGKTLIMASQSMEQISDLCNRVLLLNNGRMNKLGNPKEVIAYYKNLLDQKDKKLLLGNKKEKYEMDRDYPREKYIQNTFGERFGRRKAEILEVKLLDGKKEKKSFHTGEKLKVSVKYRVDEKIISPHFGVAIFRDDGLYCYGPNTKFDGINIKYLKPKTGYFSINFNRLILCDGDYKISVAIWDEREVKPYDYHCGVYGFIVKNEKKINGVFITSYEWKLNGKEKDDKNVEYNWLNKWLLENEEIKEKSSSKVDIVSLFFLGKNGRQRFWFTLGEEIRVKIKLVTECKNSKVDIYSCVYRDDGILCHKTGITDNEISGKENFFELKYKRLPLIRGKYHLVLIVKEKETNNIAVRILDFNIYSVKKDHGIVNLDHNWNLNI